MSVRRSLHGFTLLELSITLAIAGLVIGGGVAGINAMREKNKRQETRQKIAVVEHALTLFVAHNGALPRPSSAVGTNPGTQDSSITDGRIPFSVLNLTLSDTRDAWGNDILYTVDAARTSGSAMACPTSSAAATWTGGTLRGSLSLQDSAGGGSAVAYVVRSLGDNQTDNSQVTAGTTYRYEAATAGFDDLVIGRDGYRVLYDTGCRVEQVVSIGGSGSTGTGDTGTGDTATDDTATDDTTTDTSPDSGTSGGTSAETSGDTSNLTVATDPVESTTTDDTEPTGDAGTTAAADLTSENDAAAATTNDDQAQSEADIADTTDELTISKPTGGTTPNTDTASTSSCGGPTPASSSKARLRWNSVTSPSAYAMARALGLTIPSTGAADSAKYIDTTYNQLFFTAGSIRAGYLKSGKVYYSTANTISLMLLDTYNTYYSHRRDLSSGWGVAGGNTTSGVGTLNDLGFTTSGYPETLTFTFDYTMRSFQIRLGHFAVPDTVYIMACYKGSPVTLSYKGRNSANRYKPKSVSGTVLAIPATSTLWSSRGYLKRIWVGTSRSRRSSGTGFDQLLIYSQSASSRFWIRNVQFRRNR